jgi:putative transcriptional regulator
MITVQSTDLLIAAPGTPDNRFRHSVLMLTHRRSHADFAICVNRCTEYQLPDILDEQQFNITGLPDLAIYWGGPVNPANLWMLHSSEWQLDTTVIIDSQWSMTSSEQMFHSFIEGDFPQQFRLFAGYCAWAPGQLDSELRGEAPWRPEHAWLVAQNLGPEWLFEQQPENLWAACTTLSSHQAVDSWL